MGNVMLIGLYYSCHTAYEYYLFNSLGVMKCPKTFAYCLDVGINKITSDAKPRQFLHMYFEY